MWPTTGWWLRSGGLHIGDPADLHPAIGDIRELVQPAGSGKFEGDRHPADPEQRRQPYVNQHHGEDPHDRGVVNTTSCARTKR